MTVYVTAEVEVPVESDKRCATPNPATLASARKIPRIYMYASLEVFIQLQ